MNDLNALRIAMVANMGTKRDRPSCPKEYAAWLEALTKPLNCHVGFVCFNNAILGIECTQHMYFDLIIVEKNLRHLTGIEMLSVLKVANDPTPVILMTQVNDNSISAELAAEIGFSGIIKDSMKSIDICQAICNALSGTNSNLTFQLASTLVNTNMSAAAISMSNSVVKANKRTVSSENEYISKRSKSSNNGLENISENIFSRSTSTTNSCNNYIDSGYGVALPTVPATETKLPISDQFRPELQTPLTAFLDDDHSLTNLMNGRCAYGRDSVSLLNNLDPCQTPSDYYTTCDSLAEYACSSSKPRNDSSP